MTRRKKPRGEERIVRAALGKQWRMLAIWIEQDRPFTPGAKNVIVKDIKRLARACAAHLKEQKND